MKPRRLVLASILLAFATVAPGAEDGQLLRIADTPPVDRILIEPMAPKNTKNKVFLGDATLFLDDGTALPLTAKRTLKRKKGVKSWSYTLKSLRRAKPKAKVTFTATEDLRDVMKFKLLLKGGIVPKTKTKDPDRAALSVSVPRDVLRLHDQDLQPAALTCQATACHPNQMERYAPFRDAAGKKVEKFHYLKARSLFPDTKPEKFQDADCITCHSRVQIPTESGADATGGRVHLRRLVDTELCAGCHKPNSVGPEFYVK